MQIVKYGIVLKMLEEEELEMVRNWRNLDHVRLSMQYQEVITPQMQLNWFNTLDKKRNLYFVILKNETKIGVVNLKNIENKNAEAGIFIGEKEHLNSLIPVLATVAIMEFAFEVLQLETLRAKIAVNNLKAVLFNESIGYKKQELQADMDFNYYETNELLFKTAIQNIRSTLDKLDRG